MILSGQSTLPNLLRRHRVAAVLWVLLAVLSRDLLATDLLPADTSDSASDNTLRILYTRQFQNDVGISDVEQRLIATYAAEHDLELRWIEVDRRWQLLHHLHTGEGDIVLAENESLRAGIHDTATMLEPWSVSAQQVVNRKDSARISHIEDLAFRQVALKKSSPVFPLVKQMAEQHTGMDVVVIPELMSENDILQRVSTGQFDLTVMDSLRLNSLLPEHTDLNASFDLTSPQRMAWYVRPDSDTLAASLNTYLKKYLLAMNLSDIAKDDLPALQEKRNIRLITYQSPTNLFYKNGEIAGFEYELINRFAKKHRMRVELVLAESHEEMKQLLVSGQGDVIAASLPRQSLTSKELMFTQPYLYSAPVVVGRSSDDRIVDIHELEGRRIHLPAESPYMALLTQLQRWHGVEFQVIEAHKGMNTESTLFMVSQGMYDLTVVPSHQLKSELNRQIGLQSEFALTEPRSNVWAVRASDTKLLAQLNRFIANTYKNHTYNNLYAKYIRRPKTQNGDARLLARIEQLSPYDADIQRAAELHDFDWRLIVAQVYQESQFNPLAVSSVGAEGLMQIMPATAEDLGVDMPYDPQQSIAAGVAYLRQLRDSFEDELLLEDRIWFSLAAYNAGLGRIERVRRYTEQIGLDPNRWFGNVEAAMMQLAKPVERDGETKIRCRCGQTVVYVREIKTLYQNYIKLTEATELASFSTRVLALNDS